MQGFDYDRARKELQIPDDFQVEAMAAVGRPVRKNCFLRNSRRARAELTDGNVSESVFEGPFRVK
jgi:hypothetical protein